MKVKKYILDPCYQLVTETFSWFIIIRSSAYLNVTTKLLWNILFVIYISREEGCQIAASTMYWPVKRVLDYDSLERLGKDKHSCILGLIELIDPTDRSKARFLVPLCSLVLSNAAKMCSWFWWLRNSGRHDSLGQKYGLFRLGLFICIVEHSALRHSA